MEEQQMENFITYDYFTTRTSAESATMVADYYESLGWELTNRTGFLNLTLTFRRDRKIANKSDLVKAQKNLDSALKHIELLEKKKTASPRLASVIFGSISSLILGLGMSSCLVWGNETIYMIAGVIVGVVGIIGCLVTYPLFSKLRRNSTAKVLPFINSKYDEISNICENANKLVA